jgi:hypothetical protein
MSSTTRVVVPIGIKDGGKKEGGVCVCYTILHFDKTMNNWYFSIVPALSCESLLILSVVVSTCLVNSAMCARVGCDCGNGKRMRTSDASDCYPPPLPLEYD